MHNEANALFIRVKELVVELISGVDTFITAEIAWIYNAKCLERVFLANTRDNDLDEWGVWESEVGLIICVLVRMSNKMDLLRCRRKLEVSAYGCQQTGRHRNLLMYTASSICAAFNPRATLLPSTLPLAAGLLLRHTSTASTSSSASLLFPSNCRRKVGLCERRCSSSCQVADSRVHAWVDL